MFGLSQLAQFEAEVRAKYHIYNSVFLTLPIDNVGNTGTLLPLFTEACQAGLAQGKHPKTIIAAFFEQHHPQASEAMRIDILFRWIHYIERQVVLFDAIEDAAFDLIHQVDGDSALHTVIEKICGQHPLSSVQTQLNAMHIRPVLTAHPTQFYPGAVLGIITDLSRVIEQHDLTAIQQLLTQLAKTPFIKKEKPSPLDEAHSIIWYLEHVFYPSIGQILADLQKHVYQGQLITEPLINIGFWPGGDRDGNPFVTNDISVAVTEKLRLSLLKCYQQDIKQLKRKLTFHGIAQRWSVIDQAMQTAYFNPIVANPSRLQAMQSELLSIRQTLIDDHQSLYLADLDEFIQKTYQFGFHFASLDIRQNSRIHRQLYDAILVLDQQSETPIFPANFAQLSELDQCRHLSQITQTFDAHRLNDPLLRGTAESIRMLQSMQATMGEAAAHRYIISNTDSAWSIMATYALFPLFGWADPSMDIVPLFETIDDLAGAATIMQTLYENPQYAAHLARRGHQQTIMLGFSDGTKDGGYLMANWRIYQAKQTLTQQARALGIDLVFFDGRGGPPARGGGKTHKFYASLGHDIANQGIEVTIQGQTISSNFGTIVACRHNLENLLSAGLSSHFASPHRNRLTAEEQALMGQLATHSYNRYSELKAHPQFMPYLEQRSTLTYYAEANIGSRPSKRSAGAAIAFEDLRAIPFVGAWSQLKQNVPGFFGLGTALQAIEHTEQWPALCALYQRSLFVRTLFENSMMALEKSNFELTAYLQDDPVFGDIWQMIHTEYQQTHRLLLKLSGFTQLMANYPAGKASIQMREAIVLPLLVIQQYALSQRHAIQTVGDAHADSIYRASYEKMVIRSLFGSINASRNAA
jgi:phosphoenolpyruvate carboxylase